MVAEDKGSLEAVKSANPVGNGQRLAQKDPQRVRCTDIGSGAFMIIHDHSWMFEAAR